MVFSIIFSIQIIVRKNEPKSSEAQTSAKNKVHIISSAPYWSLVLASHVNESNAKSFIKKFT